MVQNLIHDYFEEISNDKGGQGIGLYRTEFLYLGTDVEPSEEDHYKAYRQVLDDLPANDSTHF